MIAKFHALPFIQNHEYQFSVCRWRHAPSETVTSRRTERNVALSLGQLALGNETIDNEGILKATEGLCCSCDF